MAIGKDKAASSLGARKRRSTPRLWLGAEIELMIRERERLLQAAGAAAALVASVDIRELPSEARHSLCRLGQTLASLSDETLAEAMERVVGGAVRSAAHS